MSRHTRATTVVSQPPRFSTPSRVGAAEAQPRLLHGVVGLADRAEHAVRDRAQVGPVLLEPLRQQFVRSSIGHIPPLGVRHAGDEPKPARCDNARRTIMQARMDNPAMVVPDAMQALQALGDAASKAGRAGGDARAGATCAPARSTAAASASTCTRGIAKKAGETDERLFAVAAWRDAPYFTDAERAALALDRGGDPARRPARPGARRRLGRGRPPLRRAGARRAGAGDRR